jgi:hypothetical protein
MHLTFYILLYISKELHIGSISQFAMSWLKKKKYLNVDVRKHENLFLQTILFVNL